MLLKYILSQCMANSLFTSQHLQPCYSPQLTNAFSDARLLRVGLNIGLLCVQKYRGKV